MSKPDYIIISPVRNEMDYLGMTIASVVSQTVRPRGWILVDDGSSDETGRLIDEAALRFDWIKAVHRPDRGARRAGGGVMEAFYDGYKLLEKESWEYIVKLDGDLSFGPDYFERCLLAFQRESRLGIGGGLVCTNVNGKITEEFKDPIFHVRGPTKIYRRECWKEIGGLIQAPGWDTFDQIKANMLGWQTRTFRDIKLTHHRPTGGAYGAWSNWTKNGLANYIVGYHPLFMFLKCARRSFQRPYGVVGIGLMAGFMRGYLRRIPQVDDHEVIRFLRKQQINYLIGRKSLWDGESGRHVQVCV
jgi:glycosyltransferase involved in cell wall biosynthesis